MDTISTDLHAPVALSTAPSAPRPQSAPSALMDTILRVHYAFLALSIAASAHHQLLAPNAPTDSISMLLLWIALPVFQTA